MNIFLYLRRGHYTESVHDTIRVFLTDLADEQSSHTRTGTTTQGVCKLETLETVAALSLLPHHIQDRVNQLSSFCVVALCPVVTGSTLT